MCYVKLKKHRKQFYLYNFSVAASEYLNCEYLSDGFLSNFHPTFIHNHAMMFCAINVSEVNETAIARGRRKTSNGKDKQIKLLTASFLRCLCEMFETKSKGNVIISIRVFHIVFNCPNASSMSLKAMQLISFNLRCALVIFPRFT